jgi:hypothetical protein
MQKTLLILLLFIPVFSFSQKNEIVTYIGKSSNQLSYQLADAYQLKYERSIAKSINLQAGFRYHNELKWEEGIMDPSSKINIIRQTFNSYKIDATILFLPINKERFKLKVGLGIDTGISMYSIASEGIGGFVETPEGTIFEEYWQYHIKNIPDFGVHFVFSGNYYFKNNLFCSLQAMYNQVFNEEEYSPDILRNSPVCLSIGIGHRF